MSIPMKKLITHKHLAAIVKRINDRNSTYAIETGNDLLEAKTMLKHGEFGPWLKSNFGWSAKTAQNYMNAAKLAEKNEKVSLLKPTAVITLAAPSTPEAVKTEVLADLDAGNVATLKEIRAKITAVKADKGKNSVKSDPFNVALINAGKEMIDPDIPAETKVELLTTILGSYGYTVTANMSEAA